MATILLATLAVYLLSVIGTHMWSTSALADWNRAYDTGHPVGFTTKWHPLYAGQLFTGRPGLCPTNEDRLSCLGMAFVPGVNTALLLTLVLVALCSHLRAGVVETLFGSERAFAQWKARSFG